MKKQAIPAPMFRGLMDDRDIARLAQSFLIEEVGREVTLDRLPSKDERELFMLRNSRLKTSLRRCDEAMADLEQASTRLTALLNGYPALDDVDVRVKSYLLVLQGYPLFAIVEAIEDVGRGRYECEPDRPPASPLMARRCADLVAGVATEQLRIEKILSASKVLRVEATPGARDRVMASLADFKGKVPIAKRLDDNQVREMRARHVERDRQMILAEWERLGLAPVYSRDGQPMTVALARQSGLIWERNYADE